MWQQDASRMPPHGMSDYTAAAQDHLSRTSTPIPADDGSYRLAYMSEPPNPHDVALTLGNHSMSMGKYARYVHQKELIIVMSNNFD